MAIEWKDSFATGIVEIDRHHKAIFGKIGSLVAAVDRGKGERELLEILDFLDDYTRTHFSVEEKLQQDNLYPHYILHKEEHRLFHETIDQLRERLVREGFSPHLILLGGRTMTRWLIQHICSMDRDFGKYIRAERIIALNETRH